MRRPARSVLEEIAEALACLQRAREVQSRTDSGPGYEVTKQAISATKRALMEALIR